MCSRQHCAYLTVCQPVARKQCISFQTDTASIWCLDDNNTSQRPTTGPHGTHWKIYLIHRTSPGARRWGDRQHQPLSAQVRAIAMHHCSDPSRLPMLDVSFPCRYSSTPCVLQCVLATHRSPNTTLLLLETTPDISQRAERRRTDGLRLTPPNTRPLKGPRASSQQQPQQPLGSAGATPAGGAADAVTHAPDWRTQRAKLVHMEKAGLLGAGACLCAIKGVCASERVAGMSGLAGSQARVLPGYR